MPEVAVSPRRRFDARVREALAELLAGVDARGAIHALGADDRQALMQHARLLGWEAPQRWLQMHEAAAQVAGGQAQAFEALAQLGEWCWNHSDTPDNALLRDVLKVAVLHPSVMAAAEAMASAMPQAGRIVRGGTTRRVAFVISSLVTGAATTYVMRALAPDLAAMGWQVVLVPTAAQETCDAAMRDELAQAGVQIHRPPDGTDQITRAACVAEHLLDQAFDAVVHYVWPHDFVSKLVCNLRCAPLQIFINHTCDQPTGDFDLKIGYSGDYRGHHQAERYITLPNCSVRAAQARRAVPFDLAQLGLPALAVRLATFSRLSKCVDAPFLDAMCQILRANPQAVWLLVGGRDAASEAQIDAHLSQAGVAERVAYTGFMHGDDYFQLLRAVDIYCDTITWMGGQTVADAVACGLPVVCCAPGSATALAPHGNNSTVLASQLLAPGSRVAKAGDAQDYASLAQAYIDDTALRERAGRINWDSVDEDAWPSYVRTFDAMLRRKLQHLQPPAVPTQGRSVGVPSQTLATHPVV